MDNQFSFKDFENVHLKATYNMKIGVRDIEPGETICLFDKIQIAGLDEVNEHIAARGGFDNRGWVWWDTAREMSLVFSQGVMSKLQFGLLNNARALNIQKDTAMCITRTHEFETDENGKFVITEIPFHNIYIYDKKTGLRITDFIIEDNVVTITNAPYHEFIVNYLYDYSNGAEVYKLGQHYLNGFLTLEGLTRVKDDTTGQVVTGLIRIPRLKLMSDLSMRLGAQANPVVGNFRGVAVPVGSRGNTYISEFYLLGDDINSDF